MAEFYIRTQSGGREQGPFSAKQLKLLGKKGQLKSHHEISRDGGEWLRAETVAELSLEAAPVSPLPIEDSAGGDSEWDDLAEMESDQDVYQPQRQPAPQQTRRSSAQSSAFSPSEPRSRRGGSPPEGATTILVLGLLGFFCIPVLGIVASFLGHSYMKKCREQGVSPEGTAVAGYILGRIMTFFIVLGLLMVVALVVMGVALN